jgi:hypothetical protein
VDGQLEGRPIERGECGNQEDTLKGKHDGGGSVHDSHRVKSQFFREFYSCESLFLFLVVFVSLDTSKQYRDRLGVGLSSGHK